MTVSKNGWAWFRAAFGILVAAELMVYVSQGWLSDYWSPTTFRFRYPGFEWVPVLDPILLYAMFFVAVIGALMIAANIRIGAPLLFCSFGLIFFQDPIAYLNHWYLILCYAFLFVVFGTERPSKFGLNVFRFQIAVVYVFGGIAKLNADWLVGRPLDMWLDVSREWAQFIAIGGMVFDILIVPALLYRPTRKVAFGLAAAFHLANFAMFHIGVFPFLSLAATALFFVEPDDEKFDWRPLRIAMVAWLCVQFLVPVRHWAYAGDVAWNEQGHRFSWRMKLRDKTGTAVMFEHRDGIPKQVDLSRDLNVLQISRMIGRPELVLQYARHVSERCGGCKVTGLISVSLNHSTPLLFFSPDQDLARAKPPTSPGINLSAE